MRRSRRRSPRFTFLSAALETSARDRIADTALGRELGRVERFVVLPGLIQQDIEELNNNVMVDSRRILLFDDEGAEKAAADLIVRQVMRVIPKRAGIRDAKLITM